MLDFSHEPYAPICLKFDETQILLPHCSMNSLIGTWQQVDGMHTALLHPTTCICVHVDRCVMGPDMTVHKCLSRLQLDEECFFRSLQMGRFRVTFMPILLLRQWLIWDMMAQGITGLLCVFALWSKITQIPFNGWSQMTGVHRRRSGPSKIGCLRM